MEVEGPKRPHGFTRNADMASNFRLFKGTEAQPTERQTSRAANPLLSLGGDLGDVGIRLEGDLPDWVGNRLIMSSIVNLVEV